MTTLSCLQLLDSGASHAEEMRPSFPLNDAFDRWPRNLKPGANGFHKLMVKVGLADGYDIVFGKLGSANLFSFVTGIPIAALGNHIVKVFFLRANGKMIWINTSGIVARVKNNSSFWDFTVINFVGKTMGKHLTGMGTYSYLSIPLVVLAGLPHPAFIRSKLLNLFPKSV